MTLSFDPASMSVLSTGSVSRLTSASLSATRARSSAVSLAASPRWRSTAATDSSLVMTEDGSQRDMRTEGLVPCPAALKGPLHDRLVSVRQTVAAVVAADRRLDQARAVAVAAARERQQAVAGVLAERHARLGRAGGRSGRLVS